MNIEIFKLLDMTPEEIKDMPYKEAIERLEKIVAEMQSSDCDIDRLAEYTSTAIALMNHCKDKLTKTDEEVKKALEGLSSLQG